MTGSDKHTPVSTLPLPTQQEPSASTSSSVIVPIAFSDRHLCELMEGAGLPALIECDGEEIRCADKSAREVPLEMEPGAQ